MLDRFVARTIPAEDEALRQEVRAFLEKHPVTLPASQRARSWSGYDAEFSRRMGQAGLIGLTFPTKYGGRGRSAFARFVVIEELLNAGAPVAAHWIADRQSGPLLLKYGTEAQRRTYLPRICAGEAFFCIGMSEPNSGSDLASVRTRARPDGEGWRLSGQKIWTTNAHRSHFMIALVRTSGDTDSRHEGLSQFVVDLSLPGVTVRPIQDLAGDRHFCEVFFDDVALGPDALVGDEGSGWKQVTAELAFERAGPERLYSSSVLLDEWLAWLRARPNVAPEEEGLAGEVIARLTTLREMSLAVTSRLEDGESPVVEAALVKDLGTELEQFVPSAIANLIGADPACPASPELVKTVAYLDGISPSFSLRGGTREILRGMIARGLGLR